MFYDSGVTQHGSVQSGHKSHGSASCTFLFISVVWTSGLVLAGFSPRRRFTSALTHCKSHFGKISHDNNIVRPLPPEMLSRHTPAVVPRKCCNSVIYHCEVLARTECACVFDFWLSSGFNCFQLLTQPYLYIVMVYIYTVIQCKRFRFVSYNLSEWMTGLLHKVVCAVAVQSER